MVQNMTMQGVTVTPKFTFGVRGDMKNALHLMEDKKLLYVAGHNIIIYNTDEGTQFFIQGSSNADAINFITVSPGARYLAYCERGETRAQVTIYEIPNRKKKRTLPDPEMSIEVPISAKEFAACAFSPVQDKPHLVTLSGEPDWRIIIWQWDKFSMLSNHALDITDAVSSQQSSESESFVNWQISVQKVITSMVIVVTGPSTFRYIKVDHEFKNLSTVHSQLHTGGRVDDFATNYTCHAWTRDSGRLVVGTEGGDILLCSANGEFETYLPRSPVGSAIQTVIPYGRGIIFAGEDGQIWPFEGSSNENEPYRPQQDCIRTDNRDRLENPGDQNEAMQGATITSLALNQTEDVLYYINKNNQLLKVPVQLDGTDIEDTTSEFVHCRFHQYPITGMDVCLRKQLIVTCSQRYIHIWNYADYSLEIAWQNNSGEDCYAVAFHPSGFHIIAAIGDKISMMNVLSSSIKEYNSFTLKACRELKFSNGGHKFAAATGSGHVFVYDFYTGEHLPCKGHTAKVRCIDWFADDMGFASCAQDGTAYFFDLIKQKEDGVREGDYDFSRRQMQLTGLANLPNKPYTALVVGNQRQIWRTDELTNHSNTRYCCSQVQILQSGKAFFAGVSEEGHPGSVEIWKFPLEKLNEVQCHSEGIERMRLSFDNKFLFTAGKDGCLMILEIRDRDPRGGLIKADQKLLNFSDEILTEKSEMEQYYTEKEQLDNDLAAARDPSQGVGTEAGTKPLEAEINKLNEDLNQNHIQIQNKLEQLQQQKQELEDKFEKDIKQLEEQHRQEKEAKRQEYSQKMLEDAARYNALQDQQQVELEQFKMSAQELLDEFNRETNERKRKHQEDIDVQQSQIKALKEQIEIKMRDNEETMKQIKQDAEDEIRQIVQKNEHSLTQVKDMGLRSKADLQITKNKLADVQSEIETLNRQIMDKETQLEDKKAQIEELKSQWFAQKTEIANKDTIIANREHTILYLKKKTQELEKFKFVLDYKIKDLRKDIAPKELEILNLHNRTKSMDKKLFEYNKINSKLAYMVEDLRVRSDAIQGCIKKNREIIRNNESEISSFKNAVYKVVQYIDDHQMLKIAVNKSLYHFIKNQEAKNGDIDPDIKKEYENQKKYLENSMHALKKRLEIERQIHKADNLQIMVENMGLIKYIGTLRDSVRKLNERRLKARNKYKEMGGKLTDPNQEEEADLSTEHSLNQGGLSSMEGGEDPEGGLMMRKLQNRTDDEERLAQLRRELEQRRQIMDELRRGIDEQRQEEQQLQAMLDRMEN